jgi:hypothetical protein
VLNDDIAFLKTTIDKLIIQDNSLPTMKLANTEAQLAKLLLQQNQVKQNKYNENMQHTRYNRNNTLQ